MGLYKHHTIRWTNDPNMHCSVEEIEGMKTLNPFFDWVKYATYAGNKEIDYMKVDLWVAEVQYI